MDVTHGPLLWILGPLCLQEYGHHRGGNSPQRNYIWVRVTAVLYLSYDCPWHVCVWSLMPEPLSCFLVHEEKVRLKDILNKKQGNSIFPYLGHPLVARTLKPHDLCPSCGFYQTQKMLQFSQVSKDLTVLFHLANLISTQRALLLFLQSPWGCFGYSVRRRKARHKGKIPCLQWSP